MVVSNAAASTTSAAATVTPIAVATEPASGILYGDVNHDGAVDSSDVALLRTVLTGKQSLGVPTAVADLNGDGAIDAVDLSLLNAYATLSIACLPQLASTATPRRAITATQTAPNPTQYFFYSPEKSLLSQTAIQAAGGPPALAVDTIWFNGHPVAEERLTPAQTRYTFTDHLGTPFLQADTTATPLWRAEYEPFGTVYAMRTGSVPDQRLRFPGQEFDAQTPEREYNIFRWYREGWGRYTQADPWGIGGVGALVSGAAEGGYFVRSDPAAVNVRDHLFGYALANPEHYRDEMGLCPASAQACVCCDGHGGFTICRSGSWSTLPTIFQNCIEEHENDHIDWLTRNPGQCGNQCRDASGQPRPSGYYNWQMTQQDHDDMECRGYGAEVRCLRRNLNQAQNGGDVLRRINQLINLARKNFHGCNTKGW